MAKHSRATKSRGNTLRPASDALAPPSGISPPIEQHQFARSTTSDGEELLRLNRMLRAHTRSDQALMHATREADYLKEVCQIVVEDCGYAMVWIGFAEEDEGKTVRPAACSGLDESYLKTLNLTWADTDRGRGPTGTAIRTGKPSACRSILTDTAFASWREDALRHGFASSLALPLLADGKAFGAINIYSVEPDAFKEDEVTLLSGLAGDLAYGIQMLRLQAAHATAEQRLRESEERYRLLYENSTEGILLTSPDGSILAANPTACHIFGRTEEGLRQAGKPGIVDPSDPKVQAAIEERSRMGRVSTELDCLRADGSHFPAELSSVLFKGADGRPLSSMIVRDITERKQAEEAFRRYELLASYSRDIILFVRRSDRQLLEVNAAACRAYGYTREEMLKLSIGDLRSPDTRLLTDAQMDEAEIRGILFETVHRRKDGSTFPVEVSSQGAVVGGTRILISVVRDITERKQAEEALRKAHDELEGRVLERTDQLVKANHLLQAEIAERKLVEHSLELERTQLKRILDAMPEGIYIADQHHDITYINPVMESEYGPVQGRKCYTYVNERTEPCPWCLNEAVFAGQSFKWEWHSTKSGKTYDLFDTPVRNADGTVSKLKIMHDVTARKQGEDRIKQLYEAEQQARKTAEILRSASVALTQSLDLETVLGTLLDYVGQIVPYDSAAVILFEGESRLVVRAARGYERWSESVHARERTFDVQSGPLAHLLFKEQKSLIIADTRQQPGWEIYRGAEHVISWLGVPLTVEGQVIGLCGLDKAVPGFFTPAHLQLIEALVGQAAVAVQNAWLFDQVRAGRERLASLSHRLVQVQDTERGYIARELHDEAGQSLTTLLVGLRLLKEDAGEPEAVAAGIDELSRMVEEVLEGLHRLAMDLRPVSLDHLGLVTALRQHINAIMRQHALAVGFEAVGLESGRLPQVVETNLYRIVQEALTNIIRHAHARRVQVLLERTQDKAIVAIVDDGAGFDPAAVIAQDGRLGLFGMRERAEMLGGTLTIESAVGAGTTVSVEVPCDSTRPDYR